MGEYSGEPMGDAVEDAERFEHDCVEVGELFQLAVGELTG